MQIAELTTKFSFIGEIDIPNKVNNSLEKTVKVSKDVSKVTNKLSTDISKTTSISNKLRGVFERLKVSSVNLSKANKSTGTSFSSMFKNMFAGIGILSAITSGYNYFSDTLVERAKKAEGADKEKYKNILVLNDGINKLKTKFSDFSFELLTKMMPVIDKITILFEKFSKSTNKGFDRIKNSAFKSLESVVDILIKAVGWIEKIDNKLNGYLIPTLAGLGVAWIAVSKIMKMSFLGKVALLLTAIGLVIEDVIVYMNGGDSVLGELIKRFGKFGGILAYVTPLLVGGLALFGKLKWILSGAIKVFRVFNLVLSGNPIALIIIGVVALIAAIWDLYNGLKGGKSYIADFFNEWFNFDILGFIRSIWEYFKEIFNNIIDFVKNVFAGNWSEAFENLKSIVKNIFKGLVSIFLFPFKVLIGFTNSILEKLGFEKIGKKFKEVFSLAIDSVKKTLGSLFDWIPKGFKNAFSSVGSKIKGFFQKEQKVKMDLPKNTKIDTSNKLGQTNKSLSYQTNNDTKQNFYLNVNSATEGNNALKGILGTQLSNA